MAKYTQTSDAKKGGMFTGKSHDEGGIPAIVTDTGQPIEVEGGEAIINKEATKLHCEELSKINQSAGNGVPIPCPDEAEEIAKRFETGGKITLKDKKKVFDKWRKLVNMTHTELRRYYHSNEGKKSGLSKEEADEQGISSGRESAEWILKMKKTNWKNWSNDMWKWANKQISFISRMRGNKGDLYDEKGKKTRKLMSLLIWGHNPKKYREPVFNDGGTTPEKKKSNEIKFVNNIDYGEFYTNENPDLIEDAKQRLEILQKYLKFNRVEGKYYWEAEIDGNNPPLVAYEKFYLDNNLILISNHYYDQPNFENEHIKEILFLFPDNNNEEFSISYLWTDYDRIDIKEFEKQVKEIFTSKKAKEIIQDNIFSAVVSVEGYEEYSEEFNTEKEARIGIQDIKANTKFQVVKGEVAVSDRIEQDNVIETFKGGGKPDEDELIAIHNLHPSNIIDADKLGGLITPSIAILKPENEFSQFGSITLICNKDLIDPINKYGVKVFAGDVYSPSVPLKMYNFSKRDAEAFGTEIVKKAYAYQRSLRTKKYNDNSFGGDVAQIVGNHSRWFRNLGRYSSAELQNIYYDDFKVIYLLDNDIKFPVPLKREAVYLLGNSELTLSPEQEQKAKRFADARKNNNYTLPENLYDDLHDFIWELFLDYSKDWRAKAKIDLDDFEQSQIANHFKEKFGTKERFFAPEDVAYKLSKYVYPNYILDETALKNGVNKIVKKQEAKYKEWLNDFMDQWQGSAYFEQGKEKRAWNLDNLVDATTGATRGQEDTMTYGLNKARSFGFKQFTSIADIKSKANKLLSADEVNAIQKEQSDRFIELAGKFKYAYSSEWSKMDDFGKVVADYLKGRSISSALSKNDFTDPYNYKGDLEEFILEVKNSPVDYFEAKMQRAVKLSEFKYAVVPKDMGTNKKYTKEVLEVLQKNGIKVFKYETPEQRTELVAEITKKKKLRFDEGGLARNENEAKSNLTPEQFKLVHTPEFYGWFGFWDLFIYSKANDYYDPKIREITKKLKEENAEAIQVASDFLMRQVTENDVLISMPSRSGCPTDTKKLAEAIAEKTGAKVFNCLIGDKRKSIYDLKKSGENISKFDFGFEIKDDIPKGQKYFIVDNVIGTGTTMKNALLKVQSIVGENVFPLVYSIDINNISKVVDENGMPLVVYHGTTSEFNVFKKADKFREDWGVRDYGAYFTNNKKTAEFYSLDFQKKKKDYLHFEQELERLERENNWQEWKKKYNERKEKFGLFNLENQFQSIKIYECFLSLKNPLIIDGNGQIWFKVLKGVVDKALNSNNDGIIVKDIIEQGKDVQTTFSAFKPNQIKLADGTNTTFDKNNPDIRFARGGKPYDTDYPKTKVASSRRFIPDVRGGWTKEKIVRYFKAWSSDTISTYRLVKYISEFSDWQDFKDHIYYHGTSNYIDEGLKPSITMSERQAERQGGGGYGERYYGISLTSRKRTAEHFSGMSNSVSIYPVILKRDAKVIERTDLQDASEIEDIIVDLYEQGVDAVWIGGGEEELVVVNPRSILLYKKGKEYHAVFGGFKSIPLTDEKIKEIYDNSLILSEKYTEEYNKKTNKEDKDNYLSSLPPIQFETGGLFHGSPHKFKKFSTDAIGTGEGSQAYGWGLYFTTLQDVAKWYSQNLGHAVIKILKIGDFLIYKDDKAVGYDTAKNETEGRIAEWFAVYESELKYAVIDSKSEDEAKGRIRLEVERTLDEFIETEIDDLESDPEYFENSVKIASALKKQPVIIEFESNRFIYNVTYNKGKKKPDVWLRWDISPEPKIVNLLIKNNVEPYNNFYKPFLNAEVKKDGSGYAVFNQNGENITGERLPDYQGAMFVLERNRSMYFKKGKEIYEELEQKYKSDKEASMFLKSIGIDGIKYPAESKSEEDARGFNYVVFDDSKLTIDKVSTYAEGGQIDMFGGVVEPKQYAKGSNVSHETITPEKDVYEAGNLQVRNIGGNYTYYKKVNKRWEFLNADELQELMLGQKHELEHNDTMKAFMRYEIPKEIIASSIAWEHIQETPDYYEKLEKAIPEKMAKGELIKRADGSYSQRGLWDNIRANIGSGKEPTKEMLEQEEKIKSRQKDMFDDGGKTETNMEIETPKGIISNYLDTPVAYRNVKAVRPETFIVSPYDKKFMSICNKFAGSDGLRPVMTGVSFEKNQATVTDAHKLLHVATTNSDFEGVYPTDNTVKYADKNVDLKNEKYPNWRAIIPKSYETYEVDTKKIYQYIKVASNYANKNTYAVIFKYDKNRIAFNAKFFITSLEGLMKIQNCPKLYFHISEPNRAVLISYKKIFSEESDTWVLMMPVALLHMEQDGIIGQANGAYDIDLNMGLSAYFDFSTNQIYNGDNTIVKGYQETYDQGNEMPSGLIAMFKKVIDPKSRIPITTNLCVSGGEIRAFSFKTNNSLSIEIPNDYNLADGCYAIVNNGLQYNVGYNVEDFPKHQNRPATNGAMLSMRTNAFKYYFEQTTKHIGDDDLRPALTAVLIQKKGNVIRFVGTDANTLCVFNVTSHVKTNQENDFELMISNADAINNFMQSVDSETITIYWNDADFRIDAGRLHLQSSFIDGKYPNYEAVIPKVFERTVEFNIKEIMTCIKSEELKKFASQEKEKISDTSILNVGNKIYAVRKSTYRDKGNIELDEAEQICNVDIKTTNDGGQIDMLDSLVLLMPMSYSLEGINERKIQPSNFYFNIDKLTRTIQTLGSDIFKAYYTDLNRAYILTSKQMDFSKADLPKEVKQKETKPKVVYKAEPKPKVVYRAEPKPKPEISKPVTTTNKPFMKGETYTMKDNRGRPFLLIVGELPRDEKGAKQYLEKGYWINTQKGFNGLITSYYKDIATLKKMISPEYHSQIFGEEEKKSVKPKATNTQDLKDALAGAKAFLKYATGKEKRDMEAYIRGLEILLK